jgi:hypothetical protein
MSSLRARLQAAQMILGGGYLVAKAFELLAQIRIRRGAGLGEYRGRRFHFPRQGGHLRLDGGNGRLERAGIAAEGDKDVGHGLTLSSTGCPRRRPGIARFFCDENHSPRVAETRHFRRTVQMPVGQGDDRRESGSKRSYYVKCSPAAAAHLTGVPMAQ